MGILAKTRYLPAASKVISWPLAEWVKPASLRPEVHCSPDAFPLRLVPATVRVAVPEKTTREAATFSTYRLVVWRMVSLELVVLFRLVLTST